MTTLRVLLADHRPDRRAAVIACLPGVDVLPPACDAAEASALTRSLRPSVVLLADDLPPSGGFAACETLAQTVPVLLLSGDSRPDILRRAMRAGARDVLPWTLPPADFAAALRSLPIAAAPPPPRPARIMAIAGAKGGAGRTTLAVNLAAALAQRTGEPTALLDLHTQFADAALLLGLTPRRTLADWVSLAPDALDTRFLEDYAEPHESGLLLLAGAAAPLAPDVLLPETVDRVLTQLEQGCRFIVLDLPTVIDRPMLAALARADDILLVADLFDLPTLAASRRWLDALLGAHLAPDAVRVVFNRVAPRSCLSVADGEQVLGLPAGALIPNDGKIVPASVNAGVPFVLSHPGCAPARSIAALAHSLSETEVPHAMPRRRLPLFGRRPPPPPPPLSMGGEPESRRRDKS